MSVYWLLQGSIPDMEQLPLPPLLDNTQEPESQGLQSFWELPPHLLVPRLVYVLSIMGTIALLVGCVWFRSCFKYSVQDFDLLQDFHQAIAGCLLAPVVLLMGRIGPLLGILGMLEIVCFFKLAVYLSCTPEFVTGMLALFSTQLFFFTGHFCEFSGLQFVSVFTGFDDFEFYRSGFLLGVNTFSPIGICGIVIPISSCILCKIHPFDCARAKGSARSRGENGNTIPHGTQGIMRNRSEVMLTSASVFQFLYAYKVFWSMLCATIQRRHLMIWAIFAPKFAFEVVFVLIVDCTLLVMAFIDSITWC